MKVEKIENVRPPTEDSTVTVKKAGHITEVRYMPRKVGGAIKKLNKEQYMLTRGDCCGEVLEFKHTELRVDHLNNVKTSLKNLRDIINMNVTDTSCCLFCTLTYRENMQDAKKLYSDFCSFNKRWQRHLKNNNIQRPEYITACEPQGRGAWHLHIIYIFPQKPPFIKNEVLAQIWGHGFVNIKSIKDIDNVGAYLTAYLSNVDVSKSLENFNNLENDKSFDNKRYKKAIIKGARLRMYPTGFQIYRHSRGIKKPEVYVTTEAQAMEELKGSALTYEKTIQLVGENGVVNQINYRHYNDLRKEKECYQEKNLGLEGQ